MARIVIFSKSDLRRDPRVYRQIETLVKMHTIIPVGYNPPIDSFPECVDLSLYRFPKVTGKTKWEKLKNLFVNNEVGTSLLVIIEYILSKLPFGWYWVICMQKYIIEAKLIRDLKRVNCDLIIGNDLSSLVPVASSKMDRKLIYDAHEYSPGKLSFGNSVAMHKFKSMAILNTYLHKCDLVLTVSEGIANEYSRVFKIEKPEIITNAPHFIDQRPSDMIPGKIRMVHHGIAVKQRMLEQMIDTVFMLDSRFELDFYLINIHSEYCNTLIERAKNESRIRFFPAVPMKNISKMLNNYDLGLYILSPTNFNHLHALPNKFFEFIQGRLGIAIGPSPEMAAYVNEYSLGVVSDDFSATAMAKKLNGLSFDEVSRFKQNADKVALALSAEPQMEKLGNLIDNVLEGKQIRKAGVCE